MALNILIVEDEHITALDAESTAAAAGHNVVASVPTAEEALEVAKTAHIDLVIANVDLGNGMDGATLGRELYRQYQIPTIFISGSLDEALRQKAADFALAFIPKPAAPRALIEALIIAERRAAKDSGECRK